MKGYITDSDILSFPVLVECSLQCCKYAITAILLYISFLALLPASPHIHRSTPVYKMWSFRLGTEGSLMRGRDSRYEESLAYSHA